MTDREAQIEALWTYEISTEKVLRRAVKKGFITQAEADELSEKLFEQLDTKKIPGFLPSPLGEKMRAEQVNVNFYVVGLSNILDRELIGRETGKQSCLYIPGIYKRLYVRAQ